MKNTSYYIEQYFGVLLGLFTGSLTYFKGFISWGMNNILPEKSVDICFILFGFLLTVLALIVQGDKPNTKTIEKLRWLWKNYPIQQKSCYFINYIRFILSFNLHYS